MNIAVTNHAVERYKERAPGAAKLSDESVRTLIRGLVEQAFEAGGVMDHPGHPERRIVPFQTGKDLMYLALGPNDTTYPGEWAVIGTLNDRELGKTSIGATLADVIPESVRKAVAEAAKEPPKSKYVVRIRPKGGGKDPGEIYDARDDEELADLITRRRPDPDQVEVFERRAFTIKQVYVIEKPK